VGDKGTLVAPLSSWTVKGLYGYKAGSRLHFASDFGASLQCSNESATIYVRAGES
jgi:hypothetical protein